MVRRADAYAVGVVAERGRRIADRREPRAVGPGLSIGRSPGGPPAAVVCLCPHTSSCSRWNCRTSGSWPSRWRDRYPRKPSTSCKDYRAGVLSWRLPCCEDWSNLERWSPMRTGGAWRLRRPPTCSLPIRRDHFWRGALSCCPSTPSSCSGLVRCSVRSSTWESLPH